MKFVLIVGLLLSLTWVSAQQVISAQGDSYTSSTAAIDFTVGEVVINTLSDGSNDLTQGFHQTHWNFLGVEDAAPQFEANVFPNPMGSELHIQCPVSENVHFSLFDAAGRLLMQGPLAEEEQILNVTLLAPGSYVLRLDQGGELLKNFKLVKNQ
ncbi:MAG: hypothetical protein A3D92_15960 [Bacteroidetes bacterium RIFCSPHIGHO2_02_FULL_44_7]|nr:MAG: hypothetical protein A3D92_15960 [Bacteroidetes bacterium RIFCSPHIGHO2_02_FULL_44_7]